MKSRKAASLKPFPMNDENMEREIPISGALIILIILN